MIAHTDLAEFSVQKMIDMDPNNGGYGLMLANIWGFRQVG